MTDVRPRLRLPESLRDAFKRPLGPVYVDPDALLADADAGADPIVAVGDVVTYHLRAAGHPPAVALVDGRTEREAVDDAVAAALADVDGRRVTVANESGTLSGALLRALVEAVEAVEAAGPDADRVTIDVDGEEDLATLPALLVTPLGGSVVYGQPGEGMVRVDVTDETRAEAAALLARMDGDVDAAFELLGVEPPDDGDVDGGLDDDGDDGEATDRGGDDGGDDGDADATDAHTDVTDG